jgi:two-component system, NarL family, nitrate/nitrite response regulator NarL
MVRAIVAASVRLYREGLAHSLDPTVHVVAVTSDVAGALRAAVQHAPEVALLDVSMDGGLQLVHALAAGAPGTRVVAFAVDDSEDRVLDWLEAGAAGCVGRDATVEDVVEAVHRAAVDELRCSARMAGLLSRRLAALVRESSDRRPHAAKLTPREAEVGELLKRGYSNKHIARALGLQLPTVKNHVHTILEKLAAGSRGEAAAILRETTTSEV